jgi:hypothetical protein
MTDFNVFDLPDDTTDKLVVKIYFLALDIAALYIKEDESKPKNESIEIIRLCNKYFDETRHYIF